jgi:hypothetical protein
MNSLNLTVSEADVKDADKQHAAHKAGTYVARPMGVSRCFTLRSHDDGSRCPTRQALENKTREHMHGKSWNTLVKEAEAADVKVASWLRSPDRPFTPHLPGQLDYAQRRTRVTSPKTVRKV